MSAMQEGGAPQGGAAPQARAQQSSSRRSRQRRNAAAQAAVAAAPAAPREAPSGPATENTLRFADTPGLSAESKQSLAQDFQYEYATPVQAATMAPALQGRDVLARARTGTGKTLGFLLPAVERVRAQGAVDPALVYALIVSPTRELANQIANEATRLCKAHRGMGVTLVVGGTNRSTEANKMDRQGKSGGAGNTILVCTPGRYLDHLENTSGFRRRVSRACVTVLDECDRLLDMGFRNDIVKILNSLPAPAQRQTLLYSATLPADLADIQRLALRPGHEYVNCVGDDESETATRAVQRAAAVPAPEVMLRLAQVIEQGRADPSHKIMVFCQTARLAQFFAALFKLAGMPGVGAIHSRISQSARERESAAFRASTGGRVLFTSDVSARGVDYPSTTLVIQFGAPDSKDTYVHRLGRTARQEKEGEGFLLLTTDEAKLLHGRGKRSLAGLDIETVQLPALPAPGAAPWLDGIQGALRKTENDLELAANGGQAYSSWLGYMKMLAGELGWDQARLVRQANVLAEAFGFSGPPPIPKQTVGKMGLKGAPGLNVVSKEAMDDVREQARTLKATRSEQGTPTAGSPRAAPPTAIARGNDGFRGGRGGGGGNGGGGRRVRGGGMQRPNSRQNGNAAFQGYAEPQLSQPRHYQPQQQQQQRQQSQSSRGGGRGQQQQRSRRQHGISQGRPEDQQRAFDGGDSAWNG